MKIKTRLAKNIEIKIEGGTFYVDELTTGQNMEIAASGKDFAEKSFISHVRTWSGLETEDGVDFPCTDENKKIFFDCNKHLVEQIVFSIPDLLIEEHQVFEDEKKN